MNSSLHRAGSRGPRGRAGLVAAVLLLAAGASACGSPADASPEVASLGTDAPAATATAGTATGDTGTGDTGTGDTATGDTATGDTASDDTTPVDPEDAILEYAQCMREHGIDMPDPQVDSSGNGVIVISGSTASGDAGPSETPGTGGPMGLDPAWEAAQEACQSIMDAVASDMEIDPEVLAEQREQMLDFAQCMREHGIDMPDPVFDDNGGISIEVGEPGDGATATPDDDTWIEANTACSEALGLPSVGGVGVTPVDGGATGVGVVTAGNDGEG